MINNILNIQHWYIILLANINDNIDIISNNLSNKAVETNFNDDLLVNYKFFKLYKIPYDFILDVRNILQTINQTYRSNLILLNEDDYKAKRFLNSNEYYINLILNKNEKEFNRDFQYIQIKLVDELNETDMTLSLILDELQGQNEVTVGYLYNLPTKGYKKKLNLSYMIWLKELQI